jgi:hypothetical protein
VQAALSERLSGLDDCAGKECRLKPVLKLRIDFRKGRKRDKRCARAPIRGWVRGDDKLSVEQVGFYVRGKRVATDKRRPFKRKLRYRKFKRRGKTDVRARATLIDGRRRTIDRKVRACRSRRRG